MAKRRGMLLGSAPSPGMALTPAWDIFTIFPSLLKPELSPGHGFASDQLVLPVIKCSCIAVMLCSSF